MLCLETKHPQQNAHTRGSDNLLHTVMFVVDAFKHHERAEDYSQRVKGLERVHGPYPRVSRRESTCLAVRSRRVKECGEVVFETQDSDHMIHEIEGCYRVISEE